MLILQRHPKTALELLIHQGRYPVSTSWWMLVPDAYLQMFASILGKLYQTEDHPKNQWDLVNGCRLCNFLLTRDNKRVFLYLGDIEMMIDSTELLSSAQNISIKPVRTPEKKTIMKILLGSSQSIASLPPSNSSLHRFPVGFSQGFRSSFEIHGYYRVVSMHKLISLISLYTAIFVYPYIYTYIYMVCIYIYGIVWLYRYTIYIQLKTHLYTMYVQFTHHVRTMYVPLVVS